MFVIWQCIFNGFYHFIVAYHEKKVHQLAVCPDTREYILASGSADGNACIWKLNGVGNVGVGQTCTLDKKITKDPSIDTLVFGRGPSKGILYCGVSSGLKSPLGFVCIFFFFFKKKRNQNNNIFFTENAYELFYMYL